MSTTTALRHSLFALFLFALPASAASAPSIFFTDLPTGPLTGGPNNHGAPISLYGHGFGATRGNSKVTIGGVEVAAYLEWGQNNANNSRLDRITVQPGPQVTGGPVVVTVNGLASNADITFTPNRGRVLYMAATGSDGASCSESSPCKSLLGLLGGKLKPGDFALVRTGTYLDDEVWIRAEYGMSGTPAQRKTIKAYPGERPVFARGPRGVAIEASYLTFSGLHFRNGKGIGVTDNYANKAAIGRGIWIIDNTVIGPIAYEGMGSHGNDHLFAGNVVRVQGSSQGTQGHCFYISHGDNVKLLYNQADGAPGYGIHVYDQVRQQKDFRRTITNLLIEGNVLTGSPERSGLLLTVDDGGDWGTYGNYGENIVIRNNVFARNNHTGMVLGGILRNVKIFNNTFFENGRQGLLIADSPNLSGIEIRNNLFYQSANNGVCRANCSWYSIAHIHDGGGQPSRVTIDHNGYFPGAKIILKGKSAGTAYDTDTHATTGNATANPTAAALFSNPAILDLSLLPASAAIDRGTPLPAVTRDFNGGQRPTGSSPDLGAFEFGSGGGAPASLPASALTVPLEQTRRPLRWHLRQRHRLRLGPGCRRPQNAPHHPPLHRQEFRHPRRHSPRSHRRPRPPPLRPPRLLSHHPQHLPRRQTPPGLGLGPRSQRPRQARPPRRQPQILPARPTQTRQKRRRQGTLLERPHQKSLPLRRHRPQRQLLLQRRLEQLRRLQAAITPS